MALSVAVVWELRGGAGNDNNGGSFDPSVTSPGTDYSQQDSAQITFDGSTISATAAGVTSTIVITGYAVATTDVGNTINITGGSGFATGRYTIVSVNVGSGTWTLDRNCTSGAATGMTGNMGGALATFGGLHTVFNAQANTNTPSQVTWVKASASYVFTSPFQITGSGSVGEPLVFYGYTTTRGDGGQPTITTATNSTTLIELFTNNQPLFVFRNFIFSNTAGTSSICFQPSSVQINYIEFTNCTFTGFTGALDLLASSPYCEYFMVLNCTFTSCTSAGINWSGGSSSNTALYVIGCLFNSCDVGIVSASGQISRITLIETVIYNSTSHGVYMDSDAGAYTDPVLVMINSALVGNGGDGAHIGGSGTPFPHVAWAFNCIFTQNGGWGVNFAQAVNNASPSPAFGHVFQGRSNAYYGNTSGAIQNASALPGDVTLTGDPFTNKSGLDFSLNSTAGAGAACKTAGWPTTIPGT